ncbi:sensor histidine kinase [Paractinoplanes brasiliensis]|uniref:sensor histidine kinase n=1 Tax=Paractinoplanes brasiliensis TaxID=52695 RepID=UPI00106121A3|nr:sensor histidine kinase [Actinoplanes brasiliensis]
MGGVETRGWIRDGLRAMAAGLLSIVLAVLNFPLFVLFLVSLVLTPVLGIGLVALPAVTALIRFKANLARRIAGWHGVTISRPYRPKPADVGPVGWKRYHWVITDPATWRDFAWLLPGAIGGLVLGTLTLALPAYGVEGIVLLPLWMYLAGEWSGYGVNWPVDSVGEGFLSMPQGLAFLALGLVVAPHLRRIEGLWSKLFLAPTRAAELRLRVTQLTTTRADTVDAQAAELRRIERDLHDGAQARLVSLGMTIGLAEELVERDPETARKLLSEARENSSTALVELRHLVRGIHPPVLAERGLDGAVRALALTSRIPTTVDSDLQGRLETPVESAAYFAVAEALANVQRHSAATFAYVSMHRHGDLLRLEVGDDGRGGADMAKGTGLAGMERRLAAFDGTMSVSSPPGGPTIVTMELPCASSSPRTMLSSGTD